MLENDFVQHPGEVFRELLDIWQPRCTISEAARWLGVQREHLTNVVNGHHAMTMEMATKIDEVFAGGDLEYAKHLVGLQLAYDWATFVRKRRA